MIIKFGVMQNETAAVNFTTPGQERREIARQLRENQNNMLQEAHERVQQQQGEQRRRRPRRQGSIRLSNTDSLGRAFKVRARLIAKLQEVAGGDMEDRAQGAMKMDIQMQLNRVDQQIANIRRRERAVQEERTTRRRDDTPEARRRRARDMQERRIWIRRDFLYHANNGGFDPNNPMFNKAGIQNAFSPVAFDSEIGTMDTTIADAGLDTNMEVVL